MESACVRQDELPQTSRLFADFLYRFDRVAAFYAWPPHDPASYPAAARRIEYPIERRAALVAVLREQNGASPALDALAQPDAVAVVTGQQVGLFSGPCYAIHKALTAIQLARRLSEVGLRAVPIFWLATEDHDFAEVNHCWVFDAAHRPVRLEIPGANPERRPVGEMLVENLPVDGLRQALRDSPFGEEIVAAVEDAYAPGATFGSAFARLLRKLLPGLLCLDPLDPALHRLAAPLLGQAVEAAPRLAARLAERSRQLTAAGYHTQVHLEEHTSLVFLLENGRRLALDRRDAGYSALSSRAEQLSPNALLRPVMQDYLLPTVAYIGGPGEIAYLAQSQVVYEELRRPMPVAVQRQSATLLDARSGKLIQRHGLALPDFFQGEELLRERIARTLVPPELAATIEDTKSKSARALDLLAASLGGFDPTLAAALATSRRKIAWQLSKIERKVAREALRRDQRAAGDAAWLNGLIYPEKRLQERFYSILPFLARHGLGLIERLSGELTPGCRDHRVIVL
ncbi:MAG: bacillithiol biosynthesis cysteine-adding enzyme BshC [Bryobacteraceae bacterium]|jgi:bacillithiol biosynthesis cysteine-adding enzyme BshC